MRQYQTFLKPLAQSRRLLVSRRDYSVRTLPPNSWDSHMHIVGDQSQYPLSKKAVYTPEEVHGIEDACVFETAHGTPRMVLVQPSIYGNDNTCLLDGLKLLTPKFGRGVVQMDPTTTKPSTLIKWHELGVRGVRVNIKSVSTRHMNTEDFEALLRPYADAIRPYDWVLNLHVPLSMVSSLEPFAASLKVKLCLDHFGGPPVLSDTENPYTLPGFDAMVSLLEQKLAYVKLSAIYRLSKANAVDAQAEHLKPLAVEILRKAPDMAVYSTDWPHTRSGKIEVSAYRDILLRWCWDMDQSGRLADMVFRDNAEQLWT